MSRNVSNDRGPSGVRIFHLNRPYNLRSTMSSDKAFRPSIWLATGTFSALLAIQLLFHASDLRAHQDVMQAVSVLLFALAVLSLRYPSARRADLPYPVSPQWLAPALALGTMAYASMLPLGFISDDFTHLLWARGSASQILGEQFTRGQYGAFFRPLGFASIALDYRVWHDWAPGWHLTSLVLHLASAVAVFYLCKEFGCCAEICGVSALIFAVLPVNTEAVAWMGARFDLIATLLMLWTLIFYLRARIRHSRYRYWAALFCFALALLAKESAYIIPFGLVAVELLLLDRKRWRAVAPFFLWALVALVYRIKVLGSLGGYRSDGGAPGSLTVGMSSLAGLLVRAPSELIFAVNWQQPRVVLGYLLAAAIAALLIPLAFLRLRGAPRRLLAFALTWCFFAALPAQSMLMISPTLTNSRALYFSSVGAALFMALLLARIAGSGWRRGWTLALAICLVATTRHNIRAWAHASTVTQDFLSEVQREVPDPEAGTEFVFYGMPRWTEGGVYLLLHRALADSIQDAYHRDDLTARRDDEPPHAGTHPSVVLYWVGDWRGKKRPLVTKAKLEVQ